MKLASIVAMVVLSGAAGAQTMTFTWTVGDTGNNDGVIEPGENALLNLWATMEPGATGFAGSIYEIAGNSFWQAGTVVRYDNLLDDLTNDGTLGSGNHITNIESFQLPPLFNPLFDAANPIMLYEVEFAVYAYVPQTVQFTSANHLNADVYTDQFGSSVGYDVVIHDGSFWIPAPCTLSSLGLAALAGVRRRRETRA